MVEKSEQADWIAVDWGTTHLRIWILAPDGAILSHKMHDRGMGVLTSTEFEPVLHDLVAPWLDASEPTPVIACGMVGARQGWVDAGYQATPCTPLTTDRFVPAETSDARLRVWIIPGIKQQNPADVMRGEETQIAGFLARQPDFDGVLCLPGTHTKWACIKAGEVVGFRTFMTGELFAMLNEHSVLRHTIAADGWDESAFTTAVNDAMEKPESIASCLFSLRAEALLSGLTPEVARARLSGLLIGIELAAARPYWLGQQIAIVGESQISQVYAAALAAQGLTPTLFSAEEMTLAGLSIAYARLKESAL